MSPIEWVDTPETEHESPRCLCGAPLLIVNYDLDRDIRIDRRTGMPHTDCAQEIPVWVPKLRTSRLRVIRGGKPAGSRHHIVGGRTGGPMR